MKGEPLVEIVEGLGVLVKALRRIEPNTSSAHASSSPSLTLSVKKIDGGVASAGQPGEAAAGMLKASFKKGVAYHVSR
jgi:hypothetical protein